MNRIKRIPERLKHTFRIGGPGFNWLFVGLAVLVTVVGVLFGLCSWSWIRDGAESPESNGATLRNIGLLIGGGLALVFALWRSLVAGHQADAAKRQAEVAHQQANLAQQGLLNERYQRGAEMLGNDVLLVRLGGIYALRRLAEEHPEQYHIQAMRLLCTFIRNPTKDAVVQTEMSDSEEGPPREDVQVALNTVCACHEINAGRDSLTKWNSVTRFWLDLRDAHLRGARLERVNLSVKPSLPGKTLAEVSNLHIGGADFAGAQLHSARMLSAELPGANFMDADLSDADLSDADLSRADLSHARLIGANLFRANLSLTHLLGADLSHTNLSGAELSNDEFPEFKARGLTQAQLDEAIADPDNPPKLDGVLDAEAGEPLEWRGGVPRD